MCCLLEILKAAITYLGVLVGFLVLTVALLLTIKLTNAIIFPKRRREPYSYQEQWFGKAPGPPTDDGNPDTSIKPFKVDVSDELLEDLKRRLQNTRFEDPVEGSKFHYGFNPSYLRKVVDYWLKEYDWRKEEKILNQYPHFKTNIEGIDVHFIHVKPELPPNSKVRVLPLLIIHGWPGSVVEFYKIIPLLTTPRPGHDFVFEVICPSIPGYGFSESPHQKGFTIHSAARMFATLMERIGHRKFYVQGGDWGSAISQVLARYHSSRILGLHVNMYFSSLRWWEKIKVLVINFLPFLVTKAEYDMMFPLSKFLKIFYAEGGYFHIQSTKPDTVGCAMADSPAGMAAYLLEKFAYWVSPKTLELEDGGLTQKFTMDELLTNVMLYWINNNFTAAARFYKENAAEILQGTMERSTVTVPSAVAVFPSELMMLPKTCVSQQMPNLISYNFMPRGGHFAAFEEPQLLADDIWQFVKKVEK